MSMEDRRPKTPWGPGEDPCEDREAPPGTVWDSTSECFIPIDGDIDLTDNAYFSTTEDLYRNQRPGGENSIEEVIGFGADEELSVTFKDSAVLSLTETMPLLAGDEIQSVLAETFYVYSIVDFIESSTEAPTAITASEVISFSAVEDLEILTGLGDSATFGFTEWTAYGEEDNVAPMEPIMEIIPFSALEDLDIEFGMGDSATLQFTETAPIVDFTTDPAIVSGSATKYNAGIPPLDLWFANALWTVNAYARSTKIYVDEWNELGQMIKSNSYFQTVNHNVSASVISDDYETQSGYSVRFRLVPYSGSNGTGADGTPFVTNTVEMV